jgi:hypothetical protein
MKKLLLNTIIKLYAKKGKPIGPVVGARGSRGLVHVVWRRRRVDRDGLAARDGAPSRGAVGDCAGGPIGAGACWIDAAYAATHIAPAVVALDIEDLLLLLVVVVDVVHFVGCCSGEAAAALKHCFSQFIDLNNFFSIFFKFIDLYYFFYFFNLLIYIIFLDFFN